jgi:hypothetical protein
LLLTAGAAMLGFALTFVLPKAAGHSLEDLAASTPSPVARPLRVADEAQRPDMPSAPPLPGSLVRLPGVRTSCQARAVVTVMMAIRAMSL